MWEYLKLKIKNWNLYVKHLELKNLKTKMSEFGCVNTKSWKLKIEISLWMFGRNLKFKKLKIKMPKYWKLETEMSKYWKLKIEMYEN
jgi:hypothetical protein